MVGSLLLAGLALRSGLAMRRARRLRRPPAREARAEHLRLAKPAVALVAAGFVLGPLSMWLFRGRAPFGTVHAALGILAVTLFLATALLGRRLEHGRGRPLDLHALLGTLAMLVAGAAAVAGFVLLP